ncbi:MAG: FAD-binding oxidoreductase [Clostridium sp.]
MREFNKFTEENFKILKLILKDEKRILFGDKVTEEYCIDELNRVKGTPDVVVKVKSADEVSKLISYANANNIAITPRGAGTGLVGGAIAIHGGIMIDMTLMNNIIELDDENLTLTVEPGVRLNEIYKYVEEKGLFYPPDPGEKTATIGGNIATNAGGMRCVKYGVTRDYVRGLEFVNAKGDILTVGGKVVKNSSGYSLSNLFVGSEGTLGVITKAILKLIPLPKEVMSLVASFDNLENAIGAVPKIIKSKIAPTAIEFAEREIIEDSEEYLGNKFPDKSGEAYLILKVDGNSKETIKSELRRVAQAAIDAGAKKVLIADTKERQDTLWKTRGDFLKAIKASTTEMDEVDIVVPRNRIADFVKYTHSLRKEHEIRIKSFGHAGDGNLHIYILRDDLEKDVFEEKLKLVMDLMYKRAKEIGGKVSGEHAIGFAKREYLEESEEKDVLEYMKVTKEIHDTNGIMNPGKIFK